MGRERVEHCAVHDLYDNVPESGERIYRRGGS